MSWEQQKTTATCVSTQLSFCPAFKGCFLCRLEKRMSLAAGRSLREWRLGANALQSGSDFFYAVCVLALTLQLLLKSAQLIAGAERHPILLAHLQPTHVCIPRTFLPPSLGILCTKDFLRSVFCLLWSHCSFHISQSHHFLQAVKGGVA